MTLRPLLRRSPLIAAAWLSICVSRLSLHLRRSRSIRTTLHAGPARFTRTGVSELEAAFRLALLLQPGTVKCLPKSMALVALLRSHGHSASLTIGGKRSERKFVGHAWVECDGAVIGDVAEVRELYPPLAVGEAGLLARSR